MRSIRVMGALVAIALAAAGCGGARDDDPGAEPTTTSAPADPGDQAGQGDGGADTTPSTDATSTDATEETAPPDPVAMFGDLEAPCRPGDTSGYEATDQGVTADSVTIGTGDDSGFEIAAGLNIEMGDAIEAFAAWCNDLGGINGRMVEVNRYDAKIFEVQNIMLESCAQDFMMIGQGFTLDSLSEQARVECGLPTVPGFTASPQAANGPDMVQPLPNPADRFTVAHLVHLAEESPEVAANSGIMYGNLAAMIDTKDKVISATEDLGLPFDWKVVLEYNAQGEDDWTPFVLQLKNAGVEHLYFSGACLPQAVGFLEIADLNDFRPVVTVETNFYAEPCADANTEGILDDTLIRMAIYSFEEADLFPAVTQYLEVVEADGGATSTLGIHSTSAFLLWATAADSCGAELTRECVVDALAEIHEWTGGGLHVPTDPAANLPPDCAFVVGFDGNEFVRVFPTEPGSVECRADNVGVVSGPVADQAQLDENRVSQAFTE